MTEFELLLKEAGVSMTEFARRHKTSKSRVYKWKYRKNGAPQWAINEAIDLCNAKRKLRGE